jgi:hypothetical protein
VVVAGEAIAAAVSGLEAFTEVVPFMPVGAMPVGAIESRVGPVTDTDTVDTDTVMVRQRWWGALRYMGRITIAATTIRTGIISVLGNIQTIGIDPFEA